MDSQQIHHHRPPPPQHYPAQTEGEQTVSRRTPMACKFCRARKIKCDGRSTCANCSRRQIPCEYVPVSAQPQAQGKTVS